MGRLAGRQPVDPTDHQLAIPALADERRRGLEPDVEGEVPDAEFPTMADEIRRVMGNVGQVSQLGRSFSWSTARGGGEGRGVEVAVVVRAGQTRITIQESLGRLIGATFGGIGGGLGGGGMGPIMGILFGGMHLPGVAAGAIVRLWFAGVFGMARTTAPEPPISRARPAIVRPAAMDRITAPWAAKRP